MYSSDDEGTPTSTTTNVYVPPAFLRFLIPTPKTVANIHKVMELLANPNSLECLNNRRNEMGKCLKIVSQDQSGNPNFDIAIRKLGQYIPDSFALLESLEGIQRSLYDLNIKLEFSWTSALTTGDKYFTMETPKFDVLMVLATYTYVVADAVSKLVLTKSSDNFKTVAKLLCEISGIWRYIGEMSFNRNKYLEAGLKLPLEIAYQNIPCAFECAFLAQVQEIGAINAIEKQMKDGLIGKLYVKTSELYISAYHFIEPLLKTQSLSKAESSYLADYLLVFLSIKASFTIALAYKHFGIDSKLLDVHGLAVAYLRAAHKKMEEAKVTQLNCTGVLNPKSQDSLALLLWQQLCYEESVIVHLLNQYTKDNDKIYYELVPDMMQLKLPVGTELFEPTRFVPPAFSPLDMTPKPKREEDGCVIS